MFTRDSIVSRRNFLTAAGAGMAALAGCSTGDSGSGTTPTDNSTPTPEPETTSEQSSGSRTEAGGNAGNEETTSDQQDDIENDYETQFEGLLSEDYGNWVESSESMMDIPSWAQDGNSKEWSEYDEQPLGYRDFVNVFMNPSANSSGTFIEHFLGVSDEIEDGEYDSEDPYRLVGPWHRVEQVDDQFLGTSEVPVKSSAVERFLQENVHGVIDYGEGTDEELLEYARQ